LTINDNEGKSITLSDLSENDIKIIRNFIAENLV